MHPICKVGPLFLLLACGVMGARAQAQAPRTALSPAGWQDGAHVYANVCAHCHDTGVAPAILGRQYPAVIAAFLVRNGNRAMPAFRAAEIDETALEQVAEYVSTH